MNLLARVGMLQLRLGRTDDASTTLGWASDAYARAGLRNTALALCQHILDADPSREEFLRRVAVIAGELGYREEARRAGVQLPEPAPRSRQPVPTQSVPAVSEDDDLPIMTNE